jgi:hypothetical protein
MQFENENERLVYELTRLDKPGIPEHAVAALLELHIRKHGEGKGEKLTKAVRWDEGDLHTEHEFFWRTKNSSRPIITDDGEEVEIEYKESVFQHRRPLLEEMREPNSEHRYRSYAALMADNVPRGRIEDGKYKQRLFSHEDVRAMVALVVDVDNHAYADAATMREDLQGDIAALQMMWDNGRCGALPVPAIEDSGRGIHLWWVFKQAIPYAKDSPSDAWYRTLSEAAKARVTEITKDLAAEDDSVDLEVDECATAAYRIYNLPGSINDKTGTLRWIVNDDWNPVDVCALCAALGVAGPYDTVAKEEPSEPVKPPKKPEIKVLCKAEPKTDGTAALKPLPSVLEKPKKPAGKKIFLPSEKTRLYSAQQRVQQLVDWAALRDFRIMGYRNEWLANIVNMLYSGGGVAVTVDMLQQYNQMLAVPLDTAELSSIIKTMCNPIYKARRNSNIAKYLHMTEEEMIAIDFHANSNKTRDRERAERKATRKAEKEAQAEKKTAKKKAKADAEAAKAARVADKEKTKEKARRLLAGGASVRNVAQQTGLSKSSVQRLMKGN